MDEPDAVGRTRRQLAAFVADPDLILPVPGHRFPETGLPYAIANGVALENSDGRWRLRGSS